MDIDGLSVLTHDGDVICPRDEHFGSRPATAPDSRRDDAIVIPSPCMACGTDGADWGWIQRDGLGVLVHDVSSSAPQVCAAGEPFVWETGEPVCGDCCGTGIATDDDGSVTGTIGAQIPCSCSGFAQITFPVEIGPEDEPMPGYRAQTLTPAVEACTAVAA
ncbi:hypothetical protein AB0M28_18365 [Streptomyces sp. NPDC051940]|uniref:hypothetical protein n=1 Tax=Streptomyces sp. NPDC051940 TaxID=3155675 RepID=UPI003446732E